MPHTSVHYPTALVLTSALAVEGRNNNWDFDALISMYDFVQLTPEVPEKTGWAFTKEVKSPRLQGR